MMMKTILFTSVFALSGIFASAQDDKNLVQNPSFEAEKGKLKKLGQISIATDWDSPTGMKADLFASDKEQPCSAPENQYGKEDPYDGQRYAGIVMYSYNNKEPRTYLQNKLIAPLRKDVEYCVKYYVSLSDLSKYAVDNFGVYFTKDGLEVEGKSDIIFESDKDKLNMALNSNNKVYNARYNWEPVCMVYTATGKEQFLTIGNFTNNKDTKFEKLKALANYKGTQVPTAYYYIDQVEVFILEDPSECLCNQVENTQIESVVYHKETAASDGFTIEEHIKFATVYFDIKSAKLEANMKKDLDVLAGSLKTNPEVVIELHGHLDAEEGAQLRKNPEDAEVLDLDMKRAENVKSYLVEKGIDESRIKLKSFKDKEQVGIGTTSLDHAKNRRVEFKLAK